MVPCQRRPILFLAIAVLGVAAFAARAPAQVFLVPDFVVADKDGNFDFAIIYIAGPAEAYFGSMEVGGENVDQYWHADGFCMHQYDPGEVWSYGLEGQLLDPTQPGSVDVHYYVCQGETYDETVIVYQRSVSEGERTWGGIKALYR